MNCDYLISKKYRDHFKAVRERTIICVSFFGLDPPMMKPPNVVLTGPLMRSDDQLQSSIGPELKQFLDDAMVNEEPVLYITLGSEVIW